jgi:hypothetical protein
LYYHKILPILEREILVLLPDELSNDKESIINTLKGVSNSILTQVQTFPTLHQDSNKIPGKSFEELKKSTSSTFEDIQALKNQNWSENFSFTNQNLGKILLKILRDINFVVDMLYIHVPLLDDIYSREEVLKPFLVLNKIIPVFLTLVTNVIQKGPSERKSLIVSMEKMTTALTTIFREGWSVILNKGEAPEEITGITLNTAHPVQMLTELIEWINEGLGQTLPLEKICPTIPQDLPEATNLWLDIVKTVILELKRDHTKQRTLITETIRSILVLRHVIFDRYFMGNWESLIELVDNYCNSAMDVLVQKITAKAPIDDKLQSFSNHITNLRRNLRVNLT